ncbi:MAG: hypothetical protein IPG89_05975 [Bacteroidetes bacterium]|nr:hypothetical protein [Bacteroidota bacterium]
MIKKEIRTLEDYLNEVPNWSNRIQAVLDEMEGSRRELEKVEVTKKAIISEEDYIKNLNTINTFVDRVGKGLLSLNEIKNPEFKNFGSSNVNKK